MNSRAESFSTRRRNEPEKLLQLLEEAAAQLKGTQAELDHQRSKSTSPASEIEALKQNELKRAMLITSHPSSDQTAVASVEEALLEARNRGQQDELTRVRNDLEALRKAGRDSACAREELAAVRAEIELLKQGLAEARSGVLETVVKLSQVEREMALLRARRDDLNVELACVEDRKTARTRIAELEVEAGIARAGFEKEQLAAVEVEQANASLTTRVIDIDGQLAHRENEWASKYALLESQVEGLQKQLAETTTEWRHVERQYESLHKEMLTLLDQRDEARRELQALKTPS